MAKNHKDLLASLSSQPAELERVAAMLPTVPHEIIPLSQKVKDVVSAIKSSIAEAHEISLGVQALQLEA